MQTGDNLTNAVTMSLTEIPDNLLRNETLLGGQQGVITSGPLFQREHDRMMEIFIFPFVFLVIYLVVGVIGNTIVIYIFSAKWKLTKTTIFILTLAGVDLMSCLINMPTEAAILWNPISFDHDVMCKISRYTTFIASASSSFVLVAISVDRYLMVCRPFLGRGLGIKYAKKSCIIADLLGIITTWPSLIFYGTYTYNVVESDHVTGANFTIETKTCLISNFYVEHDKLPAGFYFFLFGGHVIMFVILAMLYMLIGRKLYMSATRAIISEDKRHRMKFFGLSMMSAITGSVPSSPAGDGREMSSIGSRISRAVSLDNIHRLDFSPRAVNGRISTETMFSVLSNLSNGKDSHQIQTGSKPEAYFDRMKLKDAKDEHQNKNNATNAEINVTDNSRCVSTSAHDYVTNPPVITVSNNSSESVRCPSPVKKPSDELRLDIETTAKAGRGALSNDRLSSGSSGTFCLTPMTPITPESVRSILYRSQSVESRARLNRLIADELQHSQVKEVSLKSNTRMLRMVTIAFVVSFLPYLIIVTLRHSNPNIPNHLNKSEQIVYHVFTRLYFINSMINPFIYGFMNVKFRAKLKELFCLFCTRHKLRVPIKV
ncbi:dopamine D2-like receptor [Dreissena polymorpha]|uniref:G-protein coupled receptors family 1 profile domain-containing protein n=1 Tax=Dreissena polymorpha TaxID=45954 RepID=A0A9D4MK92_DREPO|nr:dopamine D2-like receptor [Dreissena polymorpha]XP_052267485.1 dopamine D2-like receptor [Dreissena polymorpha]KAH3878628.1 hypothetical protein DPMN_002525 [Dreissena polymorpha]